MRHKLPPKRRTFKRTTASLHCKGCSNLAATGVLRSGALTIGTLATGIRCPRLCQKTIHFVIIGLEWIAHDKKITAVTSDRVPVDHIWEIAVLEESDCPRAT